MTTDDYAQIQIALGEKIVRAGEIYWRRVRPFFFRPMLPYQAHKEDEVVSPCNILDKSFGGYQHVVTNQEKSNSTMNFLILDRLQEYSLEKLKHEQRRFIKKVSGLFDVRPLSDFGEFADQGYPAYVSFYKRTGYFYKAERTHKENFVKWVDIILNSKAIILGGYGKEGLVAVSVLYEVEKTLVYATFFSETASLRKGIGELMLHKIREMAVQKSEIQEIFVREYHGGNNMDKYYILRGCNIVKKPANLRISLGARLVLKTCKAHQYAMLCGRW